MFVWSNIIKVIKLVIQILRFDRLRKVYDCYTSFLRSLITNHQQNHLLFWLMTLALLVPTTMTRKISNRMYAPSLRSLELELTVNKQRQDHLEHQCDLLGYRNNDWKNLTVTQKQLLYVNRRRRALYCNVPMPEDIDMGNIRELFVGTPDEFLSFDELPASEQEKVMTDEYTRILFTRNPFTRLSAIYTTLFEKVLGTDRNTVGIEVIQMIRSNPSNYSLTFGSDVQFEEFAQYCSVRGQRKNLIINLLRLPITTMCNPCAIKYNMIGKYETAISDIALTLALLGIKSIAPINLQKYENIQFTMRERYDKVTLGALRNLYYFYANDFRLFDYDIDEFLDVSFK